MQGILVMQIDLDEAIVIYGRACRVWYGSKAVSIVTATANELRAGGDVQGARVWERVADVVAGLGPAEFKSAFRA